MAERVIKIKMNRDGNVLTDIQENKSLSPKRPSFEQDTDFRRICQNFPDPLF